MDKEQSGGKFPEGFLWGAATSAHQVEGDNHNDWSEWEQENAMRLSQESGGKYPPENYISGRACDHYNRYEEDFDIAKSLSHNAQRFSIEWSRIEPEEGKFDEREIEHYRKVLHALRARGLEPFVTLWHWTLPLWMRDKGGVESKEFPKFFTRYAERMVREFRDDVQFWVTLNEPTSVIYNAYFRDVWPPQRKSFSAALRVYHMLARAHTSAYVAIHNAAPQAQVGFANIMSYIEPASLGILDKLAARWADFFTNKYFLRLTGDSHDFYALQYYFYRKIIFPGRDINRPVWTNDMGWGIYPEGIYHLLLRLKKYGKPIYITENGVADVRDVHRTKFIKEHLAQIQRAIAEGADVRGYFYWSLLDNFEWDKGFWPRFGLVEVDYTAMERKIRPSAHAYARIIQESRV